MIYSFKRLALLTVPVVVFGAALSATDNAHFYKSPSMYSSTQNCWFDEGKKSATHDWLSKVDIAASGGDTRNAWNEHGKTANVLNIAGPTNLLYLGENVVDLSAINNFATFIANYPGILIGKDSGTFGQVEFSGKFSTWELDLEWRKNLACGFFFDFALPVRKVKFDNISSTDLSPETGNGGFNQQNPSWRQMLNNIDALLDNYDLAPLHSSWSKTGVGDLSLLAGWEHVWTLKEDRYVDFILKGGVLVPTGPKKDAGHVFSVPLGYNNHVGFNGFGQLGVGILSWLSMSVHGDVTGFLKDSAKDMRLKTFSKQNGYLMLSKGKAKEDAGILWHVGADVNFDHIAAGLSGRVGYSFTQQGKTSLSPSDTTLFDRDVVNDNDLLNGWSMHTMHFMVDLDCSEFMKEASFAPRIGAFYNLPVAGKNAFKTQMFGGSLGLDLRWKI